MKKPIRIIAARWFQKTYGNTYFSCDIIFDDGTTETVTKFAYGYGDHYLTVATQWLVDNGYISIADYNSKVVSWQILKAIGCDYTVRDVVRKRDM